MLLLDVGEEGGITQVGLSAGTLVVSGLDAAVEVVGKGKLRVHRHEPIIINNSEFSVNDYIYNYSLVSKR